MSPESKGKTGSALCAVALTVSGIVFGAGAMTARQDYRAGENTRRIADCEKRIDGLLPMLQDIRERVIRIETKIEK